MFVGIEGFFDGLACFVDDGWWEVRGSTFLAVAAW